MYFLIDWLPSQETAGIKRVTVKILELYFLHGRMIWLFIPQISEKGNISHIDRSSLLSPDSTGHRVLQLRTRGRNGLIPAHWGLDQQLPSPEKGFSVEAELAEFKLALWLARRPSGIICTPSCQAEAILGGGGEWHRDLLLTQEQKEAVSFTVLCRFPLCTGAAVVPTSSISITPAFFPSSSGLSLPGTGAKSEYGIFPAGLGYCCCQGGCGRVGE